MLTETYKGCSIGALPVLTGGRRFGVAVSICVRDIKRVYQENSSVGFILQIEAERESIRFGKRLVDEMPVGLWRHTASSNLLEASGSKPTPRHRGSTL